jgi:hypothetical protein
LRQAVLRKPELAFDLAQALFDEGEIQEAIAVYRSLRPRYKTANFPSLAFSRVLAGAGAIDTPVLAALLNAAAADGDAAELQRLSSCDRFLRVIEPEAPPGFTVATFTEELAEIMKADLMFFDTPAQISARKTWRNERLRKCQHPTWLSYLELVEREVDRYICDLSEDAPHPFLASRPSSYKLVGFAVVAGADSYEEHHIHPGSWLTSVYYVKEPPIAREPGSSKGWLRVGPPPGVEAPGWDTRLIAPTAGRLVLMPGYFHHGTRPMDVDQERICIVLDVVPERN